MSGSAYAIGSVLGGGGIGSIAYHAALGLHRANRLAWALGLAPGPGDKQGARFEAVRMPSPRFFPGMPAARYYAIKARIFDWRTRRRLSGDLDVFHGWNGGCLASLKRAGDLGLPRVLDRASHHARTQDDILRAAFDRRGATQPGRPGEVDRYEAEYEHCEAVLTPSPVVRDSFVARGFPPERIAIIPFGVDAARFRAEPPPEGPFRLLFVGQVCLRKGVPALLDAWDRARPAGGVLELAGPVLPECRPLAARHAGREDLRFLGMVKDSAPLYAAATACAFPSLEEGSALVSYEAMAAGRPSIVTPRVGALIEHERHGIVVAPDDAGALAEAIARLAGDPALRRRLGDAARAAVEPFSWERYGDGVAEVHRALLAGEPLPDLWPEAGHA